MLRSIWRLLMKLNDFFSKNPKLSLPNKKVLIVTNEAKEKKLLDQISVLQVEAERLDILDEENTELRHKIAAVQGHLDAVVQAEKELINTNGRLQISTDEGDVFRSENQRVNNELKELTRQLGVKEAILEQSQNNNLELNLTAGDAIARLEDLQVEDTSLRKNLEESLQQTKTSLNHLNKMRITLEDNTKVVQETEVKYKEKQHKNSELVKKVNYLTSVANTLQEEKDGLEQTRYMLKELATNVKADNLEKTVAIKITRAELTKLRKVVGIMTTNIDGLIQENKTLTSFNAALKTELAKPKFMSMAAIARKEGFKMPTNKENVRTKFLGNAAPTLLKFKVKEKNNAR